MTLHPSHLRPSHHCLAAIASTSAMAAWRTPPANLAQHLRRRPPLARDHGDIEFALGVALLLALLQGYARRAQEAVKRLLRRIHARAPSSLPSRRAAWPAGRAAKASAAAAPRTPSRPRTAIRDPTARRRQAAQGPSPPAPACARGFLRRTVRGEGQASAHQTKLSPPAERRDSGARGRGPRHINKCGPPERMPRSNFARSRVRSHLGPLPSHRARSAQCSPGMTSGVCGRVHQPNLGV